MSFKEAIFPLVDLLHEPSSKSPLDSQVLYGEAVEILGETGEYYHVRALRDGYLGFVLKSSLGEIFDKNASITAHSSFLLNRAGVKYPALMRLSYGSKVKILGEEGDYYRLKEGFLYKKHLDNHNRENHLELAKKFLHTPYLWGGRSSFGMDCSGLVQTVLGDDCPRDSGPQENHFKEIKEPLIGDLVFWRGHVAILAGEDQIIHANAHSMSVAYEGLREAKNRILNSGGGEVTSFRHPLSLVKHNSH